MTYDNVNELLALCSIEGTVKIVENHDNHLNSSVSKLVDVLNL